MPKQLRDFRIYIAPKIKGRINDNGIPEVFDEETQRSLNPQEINDKITIYKRQVEGWFLDHASKLVKKDDAGFVVLMICIAYIEGVEQYMGGQFSHNNSKVFFKRGLRRIFGLENVSEKNLDEFYSQVRCGLFHSGMTEHKVIISNEYEQIIDFSNDMIRINPKLFLDKIKKDFGNYLDRLRDSSNNQERRNFDRMFTNLP
jgi:hypothetical protein